MRDFIILLPLNLWENSMSVLFFLWVNVVILNQKNSLVYYIGKLGIIQKK